MTKRGFITLGSNIDPVSNINKAFDLLLANFEVIAASSIYETAPVVRSDVDYYLNAAVEITTNLMASEIKFGYCRKIEKKLGRKRTNDKFDPRTIDLDLVLLGDIVYDEARAGILIPDPDIENYPHIAIPLAEIAPDFIHPKLGISLNAIASKFEKDQSISSHSSFVNLPRQLLKN